MTAYVHKIVAPSETNPNWNAEYEVQRFAFLLKVNTTES